MHARTIHIMITMTLLLVGVAMAHPVDEPDLTELLRVVNDHTIPCEDRAAAERELIESSHDVSMLPVVFSNLEDPVFSTLAKSEVPIEAAYVGYSGTGSAATDCLYLPVHAQIAYARFRIWRAFAANGEPEEERKQVYADLFKEANTRIQLRHYIGGSGRNWTPQVRQHLLSIYQNPERSVEVRYSAGGGLLSLHHATPFHEHRSTREELIATAWEERKSELALRMGQRLTAKDARVAALKLDVYDHEVEKAGHTTPSAVHLIDTYFDNVSGLFLDPRSAEGHRQWIKYRDERMALQMEASETGNDTKLREFEAETAEQQRKELELRIERIDAWIAENRERLVQEAEEFAEQRERERQRERAEPEQ